MVTTRLKLIYSFYGWAFLSHAGEVMDNLRKRAKQELNRLRQAKRAKVQDLIKVTIVMLIMIRTGIFVRFCGI